MDIRTTLEKPRAFKCRAVMVCIIAGLSSPLWGAAESTEERASRPELRVILTANEREVSFDGEVALLVLLRNDSIYPMRVFGQVGFGALAGLVLHIVDENGAPVQSPFYLDAMARPPKRDDPHTLVHLEGGLSLGVNLNGPAKDLFPSRGRYRLWVTYLCPLSQEYLPALRSEVATVWRESGVFESEAIEITVK